MPLAIEGCLATTPTDLNLSSIIESCVVLKVTEASVAPRGNVTDLGGV